MASEVVPFPHSQRGGKQHEPHFDQQSAEIADLQALVAEVRALRRLAEAIEKKIEGRVDSYMRHLAMGGQRISQC